MQGLTIVLKLKWSSLINMKTKHHVKKGRLVGCTVYSNCCTQSIHYIYYTYTYSIQMCSGCNFTPVISQDHLSIKGNVLVISLFTNFILQQIPFKCLVRVWFIFISYKSSCVHKIKRSSNSALYTVVKSILFGCQNFSQNRCIYVDTYDSSESINLSFLICQEIVGNFCSKLCHTWLHTLHCILMKHILHPPTLYDSQDRNVLDRE